MHAIFPGQLRQRHLISDKITSSASLALNSGEWFFHFRPSLSSCYPLQQRVRISATTAAACGSLLKLRNPISSTCLPFRQHPLDAPVGQWMASALYTGTADESTPALGTLPPNAALIATHQIGT